MMFVKNVLNASCLKFPPLDVGDEPLTLRRVAGFGDFHFALSLSLSLARARAEKNGDDQRESIKAEDSGCIA